MKRQCKHSQWPEGALLDTDLTESRKWKVRNGSIRRFMRKHQNLTLRQPKATLLTGADFHKERFGEFFGVLLKIIDEIMSMPFEF
jgi:hypothetical protein